MENDGFQVRFISWILGGWNQTPLFQVHQPLVDLTCLRGIFHEQIVDLPKEMGVSPEAQKNKFWGGPSRKFPDPKNQWTLQL